MCQTHSKPFKLVASICFGAAVIVLPRALWGQAAPPTAPVVPAALYAADQAAAGEGVFAEHCVRCHLADLSGRDDAPPLAGAYFASSWGGHKVSELIEFVAGNMPFDQPATLDDETVLNAVAYVLARNGVPSGPTRLAQGAAGVITVPAQQQALRPTSRVTVSFDRTPMHDVLAFFAQYAGRSIVAGTGVGGEVSATVHDQPWDRALEALLAAHGLAARELESGILLVQSPDAQAEAPGRLLTRTFRLNYATAAELQPVVQSMLSERGSVAALASLNALVVTDEARVLDQVASVIGQ